MRTTVTNPGSPLIQNVGEIPPDSVIFGSTEAMRLIRDRLEKVAGANVPVLIQGESGTGKDILARLVHQLSPWRTGPYVIAGAPVEQGCPYLCRFRPE